MAAGELPLASKQPTLHGVRRVRTAALIDVRHTTECRRLRSSDEAAEARAGPVSPSAVGHAPLPTADRGIDTSGPAARAPDAWRLQRWQRRAGSPGYMALTIDTLLVMDEGRRPQEGSAAMERPASQGLLRGCCWLAAFLQELIPEPEACRVDRHTRIRRVETTALQSAVPAPGRAHDKERGGCSTSLHA